MNLNKTNKTLIVCLTFILGVASTLLGLIPYFAAFLLVLILYLFYFKVISYKLILINCLVLVFSIFYTNFKMPQPDDLANLAPIKASLQGRVITQLKDDGDYKTKFEFEVNSLKKRDSGWKPVKAKTLVTIFDKKRKFQEIYIGDVIEVTGYIRPPFKATNPGQFDYTKYLSNSGIFTITYVGYKDFKIIEHPKSGKWAFLQELNKVKNKIISIHRENLKSPKVEILGGMVFGDYAVPTPKNVKQDFINSGLLHLLAASGMNVALIFGIWTFLAQKLFIPFNLRIIGGMVLVAVYAFLTGLPPSVTRATWMLEFILFGKLINRQADNVALLALVCAIMLLFDPLMITDIGFQLSFVVTFGLLMCTSIFIEKLKPIPIFISGSILIPIIAQLWVAPIQLFHFNTFATYSVFANIIVVPFVGIISFAGFTSSIFCLIPVIGERVCWFFDKLIEPFIALLLYISKFTSDLPGSLYYFASPEILSAILFYILILVITLHIKWDFSKKKLNFLILAIVLAIVSLSFKENFSKDLKLLFFDVGEADSILIQTPNKRNILVDTGDIGRKDFSSANTIIIPYLRDKGINKLDVLVLTHPDRDHIGGTVDVLKRIKTSQIMDNGEKTDSTIYKKTQDFIRKKNITVKHLTNGNKIDIDKDLKISVIKSANIYGDTNNDTSVILYLEYKNFSALLMGDAEAESLNSIKKYVNKSIDVVKVGHHGSFNSVNEEFLDYLKPKTAIISVGKNKYSHPDKLTLNILKEFDIKTLRTDKDNAIEIKTDGENIKINSYNAP
ncbi:MAG: DNA internalization-related competence protein ComEC/Rec2 [Candidatus Melainabacteria bacterium RIFOXYA12_FULL_32_12]|nr:MAG: DNA internalization-related competence protein ComEC/Rec2 [Candidatus Melainabacteria bacterium RIFOXYA2_FULL_32_9]OGI26492.1 MAG: DNA internalization-related competence protein ComEC/Rec2 [Candidatus Melainabacteria bacterium RIFOXYA12_FULL_32_12]